MKTLLNKIKDLLFSAADLFRSNEVAAENDDQQKALYLTQYIHIYHPED